MWLIYWILNKLFGYKKPNRVINFKAELIDMSNVRLSWVLPDVGPRQKPILHTEISVRVSPDLPWTVQDVVVPGVAQELVFFDVFPGVQYYQAVVVDTDNTRGAALETNISIPFDAPGVVSTLTATLE